MVSKPINSEELIANVGCVAVLMGGSSAEREISLLSGTAVFEGLLRLGANCISIDVQNDLHEQLAVAQPDLVFNMMHGQGGEDGVLQGYLETVGLPYTGSGVLSSALAMDKVRSKLIWQQLGLNTADFVLLNDKTDWQGVINKLAQVVVKPVSGGSSLGIAICTTAKELEEKYRAAVEFDDNVFAEQLIGGREYSTGIIGGSLLPTIQLETDREFFDFDAKYVDDNTRVVCPPQLEEDQLNELNELVLNAYLSLGCNGLARVDVMQGIDEKFYLLEVNTVPGMTSHSFVPMAAKEAGIGFDELLLVILADELANGGRK